MPARLQHRAGLHEVDTGYVQPGQPHLAHAEEVGEDFRVRRAFEHPAQIADVVCIHMAEPDPAQILCIDLALQGLYEDLAEHAEAGVDQHGFLAFQQKAVDRQCAHSGHRQPGRQNGPGVRDAPCL